MPVLLRYTEMSEAQRQSLSVKVRLERLRRIQEVRSLREGRTWNRVTPYDWRFTIWFTNDRKRPVENRDPVYLSEETPFEVLTTIPCGGLCWSLVRAALEALRKDVLDSKAPLLILCDFLEEQGMPEADLLRAFAARKQRWDRYCLNVGQGGGEQGGV